MQTQTPETITRETIKRVTPTRLFGPHDTFLTAVAFSYDGHMLVSGDLEGYLKVWDVEAGTLLAQERAFTESVQGIVFGNPNAEGEPTFIAASKANNIKLLTIRQQNRLVLEHRLRLESFDIVRLGYTQQQRPVIACVAKNAFDKRIYLMHADDKSFLHAFSIGNDENPNVTFSADGTFVAVGGLDGRVVIRSMMAGGRSLHKVQTELDGVRRTALTADGKRFAALEDKGDRILIYDIETAEKIGTELNEPFQNEFAFSHDGQLLAVTSLQKGGSLNIYDVTTGQRLRRVKGSSPLTISPTARSFAAGNNYAEFSKSVMLWDTRQAENSVLAKIGAPLDIVAADAQNVRQFAVFNAAHDGMVTALAFSTDAMTLASGGTDDDVHVWDMETGGQTATLLDHKADVTALAYSPDGKVLASASGYFNNRDDNSVRLWDTDENTPQTAFTKHRDKVVDVQFHPRGEYLVSADAGGRVIIWRTRNQEVIRTIDTPTPINHMALSPDGALLATAHGTPLSPKDTSLRLWNTQTGEKIREYTDMLDWIVDVTFSPDGNVLLAADHSKRVCGWDLRSGTMVLDLPDGERARYNPQNNLIALAQEKTVKLISVRGSHPKVELRHGDQITSMAFNPEGELLAVGLQNGDIVIWGVPEGRGMLADTGELDVRRLTEAARSGRFALQLISISCNKAQERDGDEIFIRIDGQTIWSVKNTGRKMHHRLNRNRFIDTFDFSNCRMHGKNGWQPTERYRKEDFRFGGLTGPIEIEVWEEDLFLRGGDDFVGKLTVTPAQAGQSMIRTVVGGGEMSYTLTYGVLFE